MHICMYTFIYICVYVYTCIYIYIYMYTYVCVSMFLYIRGLFNKFPGFFFQVFRIVVDS